MWFLYYLSQGLQRFPWRRRREGRGVGRGPGWCLSALTPPLGLATPSAALPIPRSPRGEHGRGKSRTSCKRPKMWWCQWRDWKIKTLASGVIRGSVIKMMEVVKRQKRMRAKEEEKNKEQVPVQRNEQFLCKKKKRVKTRMRTNNEWKGK